MRVETSVVVSNDTQLFRRWNKGGRSGQPCSIRSGEEESAGAKSCSVSLPVSRSRKERERGGEIERQRETERENERASRQRVENWTGRGSGVSLGVGVYRSWPKRGRAAGMREIDQERVPGWAWQLCRSGRSERRTTWVCLDAEACSESGAQMGEGSRKMAKDDGSGR